MGSCRFIFATRELVVEGDVEQKTLQEKFFTLAQQMLVKLPIFPCIIYTENTNCHPTL
jgi:hypothetical protein